MTSTEALTASPWDPRLHPRGRDGRFIEIGSLIRWLLGADMNTGTVREINPDGTLRVTRSDGAMVKVRSGDVLEVETPKAHIAIDPWVGGWVHSSGDFEPTAGGGTEGHSQAIDRLYAGQVRVRTASTAGGESLNLEWQGELSVDQEQALSQRLHDKPVASVFIDHEPKTPESAMGIGAPVTVSQWTGNPVTTHSDLSGDPDKQVALIHNVSTHDGFIADNTPQAHLPPLEPALPPVEEPDTDAIYARITELQKVDPASDEVMALFAEARESGHTWKKAIVDAIASGKISPEDAYKRWRYPDGSGSEANQSAERFLGSSDWTELPPKLYHVTTNAPAVRQSGVLLSRQSLRQGGEEMGGLGNGLGGGSDESVSFTDDPEVARQIQRAMLEASDVAAGRKTITDMLDDAAKGADADSPFLADMMGYWTQYTPGQTKWAVGDPYPGGVQKLLDKETTPAERLDFFKIFATMRQLHNGPMDPLFFGSDADAIAKLTPDDVGIIEVDPPPGTYGVRMGALGEIRLPGWTGIPIAGQPDTEALLPGLVPASDLPSPPPGFDHTRPTGQLVPALPPVGKPGPALNLTDAELPEEIHVKEAATWEKFTGDSFADADQHLQDVFEDAMANDPEAVANGRVWYHREHDDIVIAADQYGFDHDIGFAVASAISPGLRWETNRDAAVTVLQTAQEFPDLDPKELAVYLKETNHWQLPHGWEPVLTACAIVRGADIDETLTGCKRRSFFNNLRDPDDPLDVTIDSHMIDAAKGGLVLPGASGVFVDAPRHKVLDRMYRKLGWIKQGRTWSRPPDQPDLPEPIIPKDWEVQVPPDADYTAFKGLTALVGTPKYKNTSIGVIPPLADSVRRIAEDWSSLHPDDPLSSSQVQAIIWEHQIALHPDIESRNAANAVIDATAEFYLGEMA